jgi:hypothetical protein
LALGPWDKEIIFQKASISGDPRKKLLFKEGKP